MDMNLFFVVAWVVSVLGTLLLGAVAVTYIRRTWQLIRAEDDDPTRERLLDGIDHLENQMHLVAERLGSLEERLGGIEGRLEAEPRRELPPASPRPEGGTPSADATGTQPGPDTPASPSEVDGAPTPSDPSDRRG